MHDSKMAKNKGKEKNPESKKRQLPLKAWQLD